MQVSYVFTDVTIDIAQPGRWLTTHKTLAAGLGISALEIFVQAITGAKAVSESAARNSDPGSCGTDGLSYCPLDVERCPLDPCGTDLDRGLCDPEHCRPANTS